MGSARLYHMLGLFGRLCALTTNPIVGIDYSLVSLSLCASSPCLLQPSSAWCAQSPEYEFPTALNDTLSAYQWLIDIKVWPAFVGAQQNVDSWELRFGVGL
jgi:hypothetical protein